MWFWFKNLLLAIALLAIAAFLLLDEQWTFGSKEEDKPEISAVRPPQPASAPTPAKEEEQEDPDTFSLTTSKAATGLSSFYGKVRGELLGTNKTMGDGFVLKLEPSSDSLDDQLRKRGNMVQPASPRFKGETANRRFRSGDTLKQILETAAQSEGMELMWRLDRDYVIKHYFQVESNLLATLGTVASALNSDFEKEVFAFYCYKQRAIVITQEVTDFVKSNCRRATSKT